MFCINNVIEFNIPPLRRRAEDIPVLVDYFLVRQNGDINGGSTIQIDPEALTGLTAYSLYSFPGNVRELDNILQRVATLCDSNIIRLADLQLPEDNPTQNDDNDIHTEIGKQDKIQLDSYLGDVERNIITQALEKYKWNKTATAKSLGITLRALRYRLEKLGLE